MRAGLFTGASGRDICAVTGSAGAAMIVAAMLHDAEFGRAQLRYYFEPPPPKQDAGIFTPPPISRRCHLRLPR